MRRFNQTILFVCGLLLTLAAFPVSAQKQETDAREINVKPFRDFTDYFTEKVADGKTDLNGEFLVQLEGVLDKEGKFDVRKSKYVKSEGDERLVGIAKTFIEALSASGVFGYLRNVGAEKINFTLAQNDNQLYSDIVLEQASAEKAMTITSGFNALIKGLRMAEENGIRRLDDNSKLLLSGLKVSSEGTNAVLKFACQKSAVQDLINRNLKQQKRANR